LLAGKKILLGITGSIAAYKSILLVRFLVKAGAEVKVIMTPAAKDFVPALTLSTLSKNPVLSDLSDQSTWANHVMLGRWADIMLIAPLSANTLAKMANGLCDNLLLATYLSSVCPVAFAPAMDEDMWNHPSTRKNLARLHEYGNHLIPVGRGDLASGLSGEGRMAEPEEIISFLDQRFFLTSPLRGKKVLVTAGPTYEPIDPVRFIGNHSSGKMGIAIAKELYARGAEVTVILGPTTLDLPLNGLAIKRVKTAAEMYEACLSQFEEMDIAVMAAAVADYSPSETATTKIKKKEETLQLELNKTKDILASLGKKKRKDQVLVGFALETNNEKEFALEKLASKNADMIVMNSLQDLGAGFGVDTNKVTIFANNNQQFNFATKSKDEVAKDIVDTITTLFYV
jgi:phosphopantothenoylcysteine decarboxylase/phosphopantothenate--cysteine ligase